MNNPDSVSITSLPVVLREAKGTTFIDVPPADLQNRRVKRFFDLFGAVALLILSSPLWLCVALLIRIESPGPVLFRQRRRLHRSSPPFTMYKFRTMVRGADGMKKRSAHSLRKSERDPRITRVGAFLRRYSIDEIPQLLNVLKGEMSLVGPRPLPQEDFDRIRPNGPIDGLCRLRTRALPGMTGLWQISGRSTLAFHDMLLLDVQYIRHQGILLDLEILLRTIPAVVTGHGAY